MLKDLLEQTRSYRQFHQDLPVPEDTLRELVALTRLVPSANNVQALRYPAGDPAGGGCRRI